MIPKNLEFQRIALPPAPMYIARDYGAPVPQARGFTVPDEIGNAASIFSTRDQLQPATRASLLDAAQASAATPRAGVVADSVSPRAGENPGTTSRSPAIGIFEANNFDTPSHRDRSSMMESIRLMWFSNPDSYDGAA